MKRTKYTVMAEWSMSNFNGTWRRVYADDSGERFIRKNGEYISIENNEKILETLTRD